MYGIVYIDLLVQWVDKPLTQLWVLSKLPRRPQDDKKTKTKAQDISYFNTPLFEEPGYI